MLRRFRNVAIIFVVVLLALALALGCGGHTMKTGVQSTPARYKTSAPASSSAQGAGSGATLTARFINVGEADSCILKISNGAQTFFALVDTGGIKGTAGQVVSELRGMGCGELNVMVLTHPDADHVGGAAVVMDSLKVDQVWDPETDGSNSKTWQNVKATIASKGIPVEHPHAGDTFDWDGVATEVLNPPAGASYTETNDWSIVLLESLGSEDILLAGDAETAAQQFLMSESFPTATVFKVPHHGALTGYWPPFFDRVHPANSVISVGPNSYGHPSASVVAALASFGSVYETETNGDITVTETANSLQVTPAASAPAASPSPQASPSPALASGPFVGSVKSNIYHYPSCPWAQKIKPQNLITFSSAQDAVNHGYRPCGVCHPPLP